MSQPGVQPDLARAIAAHSAGQHVVAESLYRALLQRSPDDARVLCMCGTLFCQTGRLEAGIGLLRQAVAAYPRESAAQVNLAHALNLLGVARKVAGAYGEAVAAYREALRLSPRASHVQRNLGLALLAAAQVDEAIAAFETAVALAPDDADAQGDLGYALRLKGQPAPALAVLERAAARHPQHDGIRVNLANTLVDLNRAAEALSHYERAIAALPRLADLRASYAMALDSLGRHDAAEREYRAVLALDGTHPDALFCLGLRALLRRDYAAGWRGYEYRWSRRALHSPMRQFPMPRWNGEPLAGKCLLIHAEQGIGDEIMFAGVLPELIGEASHCVVECSPKLAGLFRSSFPAATIVATDRNDADWFTATPAMLTRAGTSATDLQIPAGSLPSLRRRTVSDFPRHDGYLRADPVRVEYWRSRLAALGPGLKVGLAWSGGTARTGTLRRSMRLRQLLPLIQTPGAHFVSVQYTPCAEELAELTSAAGCHVHHWQEAIDDYGETAALLSALDLTVSVCTAVIHLGGALGRPVWVMAPQHPEWRYGIEGEDMPWYPGVRIFRQEAADEFGPVIERVAAELRTRCICRQ